MTLFVAVSMTWRSLPRELATYSFWIGGRAAGTRAAAKRATAAGFMARVSGRTAGAAGPAPSVTRRGRRTESFAPARVARYPRGRPVAPPEADAVNPAEVWLMTRPALLACALALLSPAAVVPAPLPKDTRPVIAPAVVNRLKPVGEVDHDVYRLIWGPRAGEVALLSFTRPAEVLDDRTLKPVRGPATGRPLIHMAMARDRSLAAWCENGTRVEVHDLKAGTEVAIETGQSQPSVAFSKDGKLLATGGYGARATLWDLPSGKRVRDLDAGGEGGLTVVFSPDGKVLAVGNRNYETRLYEAATGKLLHTLGKAQTQGLKFRPDGKVLAVGYVDGEVRLWDVGTGKLARSAPARVKEVYEVDWTPKGDVLVTAGREGKIVLWDPRELTVLRELESPEWVIQARFSPDGTRLWTAGGGMNSPADRKVVIWGLPDR